MMVMVPIDGTMLNVRAILKLKNYVEHGYLFLGCVIFDTMHVIH